MSTPNTETVIETIPDADKALGDLFTSDDSQLPPKPEPAKPASNPIPEKPIEIVTEEMPANNAEVVSDIPDGAQQINTPPDAPNETHESRAQSKRGRHPKGCNCGRCKQSSGQPDFSDLKDNLGNQISSDEEKELRAHAEQTFDFATFGATMLIGPEWQARTPEEREGMILALKRYLATQPKRDIPPSVALAFACLFYSIPRFQTENTQSKVKAAWQKVLFAWAWFKIKCGF